MNCKKISIIFLFLAALALMLDKVVFAQSDMESRLDNIERRMGVLEEYIINLEPRLKDMSVDTTMKINESMERSLDLMKQTIGKVILLNPGSQEFQKIETDTATFLVSVHGKEKTENGFLLILHIGNPNSATYSGVNIKLKWGKKFKPNSFMKYTTWRQSLHTAEFPFAGLLEPGSWTEIIVDLSPATPAEMSHIECSMDSKTVQLQRIKYR